MKKVLRYLKDYKKECVLAPLFKLLEASFELVVPFVMAAIIDNGIAMENKKYIIAMGGVLLLFAAIGFASATTAQYFAAKAAVGFSTKLRHALFEKIESLSFSQMDTVGNSTLITRMTSDVNQVQSGVNMVLRLFLRSPFIVFGAMIMAFTISVPAAIVFVVTIPLLSIVVFTVMVITIPMYKRVQFGLDRVLGHTRENLEGVRVVRAFIRQDKEIEDYCEDNESLTGFQIAVGKISALTNPLTFVIVNCATLIVIYVGGKQTYIGNITQGQVVALVNLMSQILVELIKLANLIVNITKSIASGNRIGDILEMESSLIEKNENAVNASSSEEYVVFDKVCMTYEGAADEALTDIDFKVEKGQIIGIIGGTGSGKSTLVNMIPRFYDASKGVVKVNGVDVKEYPVIQLRDMIGVVPQKAVLFAGTIAENLRWGNPNASDEELWEALEIAQAADVVRAKEDGLDHMVEQEGRNLSGGQRQRLTIARALVKKPEILILDDSASALDFATDKKLRNALEKLRGKMTIFIVSQRTSSIQFANKIVVLDDGEMVGLGSHNELIVKCDVYREIYSSQFKKETQNGGVNNA